MINEQEDAGANHSWEIIQYMMFQFEDLYQLYKTYRKRELRFPYVLCN